MPHPGIPHMLDVVFIASGVVFFTLAILYAEACAKL
jgi:hypothetical protein